MSSMLARTGRHRQRYENEFRLVAGCIPYRLKRDIEDTTVSLENMLEVLMISSPNREDLVFPKGGWENDETVVEAASREALEEAGVKGILDEENPLGVWVFRSKSNQMSCSPEGACKGIMFAMEVTEEFCSWAEEDNHRRIWLTAGEASKLCRYEWMREALDKFLRVMSESGKYQIREELVEPPELPVEDVVLSEHQVYTPSCFVNSSNTQRYDETYNCFAGMYIHLPSEVPLPGAN